MKRWLSLIIVIILGGSAGLWFVVKNRPAHFNDHNQTLNRPVAQTEKDQTKALQHLSPLNVDDFMQNVDRHKGIVRIQGVVTATDANRDLLALIDAKEFEACQTTTCAQLTLPVRWPNDMPKVAQTIVVTGSVQNWEDKRIFVASNIEPQTSPEQKPNR